jgi:predicted ArsR family transcriptional regulator
LVLFTEQVKTNELLGARDFCAYIDGRYAAAVSTVPAEPAELGQEASITALAVLGDEQRRRLFSYVQHAHRPVSREEAAESAGISRKLAAHHLDKLVAAGLLSARYEPPAGIRKVGRAPKLYQLSGTDLRVSIPARRHEELARIFLDAVLTQSGSEDARQASIRAARQRGQQLGTAERDRLRPGRLGAERALTIVEGLLGDRGFEPARPAAGEVELRNCPFHPLAAEAPGLVCGINHAYLGGVLEGLGADALDARLEPQPGHCCVRLRSRVLRS